MFPSMHRDGRLLVLFALVVLAACGQSLNATSLSAEISNGAFQKNDSGRPADWFIDNKVASKGDISVYRMKGGEQVLRLVPNSENQGKDLLGAGQMLDASSYRGKTINASAALAATGAATAVVGVHVLGQNSFVQLSQGNNEGKLIRHQGRLEVPDDAENIIVYAIVVGQSGTAYFDNIELSVLGSDTRAAAAAPTIADSGQPPLAASLRVDLGKAIRKVPDSLLGTNVEWINNAQGLWSTKLGRLDPQAVELARDMGFTLVRFPGGAWSDYYFWRNGVGERGKRPVSLHNPNGHKSTNNFGTDEALEFASLTDSELFITVNAGTGTPELAADWVSYVNKTRNAGVTWWEIGNELYMEGDFSGAEIGAREYADKVLDFISAMKKVDPGIKLGAIGGLNFGSYAFIKDQDWTDTVLERTADKIDFLAVHNAYAPIVMGVTESTDPHDVYRAMLAAPINIARNFQALDRKLAKYDRGDRKISLAVTEWGPMFHILPSNPWVDHIKTLGSSLFVASTMNTFLRQPRVEIAHQFKLTDLGFMGWIGNEGPNFKPTALYLAFQMYKEIGDSTLVDTEVEVGGFDSPALGVVEAIENVPYLDAVTMTKGGEVVIFAVNKHFIRPIEAAIKLNGKADYSRLQVKTLTGTAMDAHTGTHPPEIPGLRWARQVELSRFSKGGDGEVTVTDRESPLAAEKGPNSFGFSHRFPPRSLTRITLSN